MQTPDRQWRVQIIDSDTTHWYRLSHAGNTIDWLTITDVEQLLAHAGIDIGQLQDSGPPTQTQPPSAFELPA